MLIQATHPVETKSNPRLEEQLAIQLPHNKDRVDILSIHKVVPFDRPDKLSNVVHLGTGSLGHEG